MKLLKDITSADMAHAILAADFVPNSAETQFERIVEEQRTEFLNELTRCIMYGGPTADLQNLALGLATLILVTAPRRHQARQQAGVILLHIVGPEGVGMYDGKSLPGVVIDAEGHDSLRVLTTQGEKIIRSDLFTKNA